MVEWLLSKGASPNSVSHTHESSLEWAARSGSIRTVELLLAAGANSTSFASEALPEDGNACDEMSELLRRKGVLR